MQLQKDYQYLACVTSNVSTILRVRYNVSNTTAGMFGKKGIKRFFFSWQNTDHDEVVQAMTGDLDQVKGIFLITLLS